jgi:4-hydroxy-tetrahydrodipicolinate reductase
MRVAVTGATGRMGGEVIAAACDRGHDVVLATARDPAATVRDSPASPVHGVDVEPASEFSSLVATREPNAAVDFTAPAATVEYATAAADAGVAFVTGTTGLDDEAEAALDAASERVPVLHAPNFARGVQALLDVVGDAVAALPGYDVELVETHHAGKRDAPSGTADAILDRIEATRDASPERDSPETDGDARVHGREGDAPRAQGEIGVHSVRAGDVPGEHELVLAGNDEELRLTHRATDRGVFAAGALDAAEWLSGRDPGRYAFADVVRCESDREHDSTSNAGGDAA